MKKKILILLLIPIIFIGLTGCGKTNIEKKDDGKKSIVLEDKKLGLKTTFKYEDKLNISDIEFSDEGASKSVEFDMEDQDAEVEMYYTSMSDTSYKNSQDIRSKQKHYKEYKFGKYKGYAFSEYDSNLKLNIILNENDNKMYDVLFVDIERLDTDQTIIMSEIFDNEEFQELFNSINFVKTTNKQQ